MHRSRTYVYKTRSGRVQKVVREHYLRDDVVCGVATCEECQQMNRRLNEQIGHSRVTSTSVLSSSSAATTMKLNIVAPVSAESSSAPSPLLSRRRVYVLDTNVLLHQMDALESKLGVFDQMNLVILQTVLEEVKHNNMKLYNRVRALIASHPSVHVFANEHHRSTYVERTPGESPNDRNDRAIRVAARWYEQHLRHMKERVEEAPNREPQQNNSRAAREPIQVVLMTEDRGNREKALFETLSTISLKEFVQAFAHTVPRLVELTASMSSNDDAARTRNGSSKSASNSSSGDGDHHHWDYDEHVSGSDLKAGLDSGVFKRGTFKVNLDYFSEAYVNVRGVSHPVLISDLRAMNRAVDGDIVAIQLLPSAQWKRPSTRVQPSMDEADVVHMTDSDGAAVDKAPEVQLSAASTASTTQIDPTSSNESGVVPTGKVVAVIQRNWRPYCGSIEVASLPPHALLPTSVNAQFSVLFQSVNRRVPKIRFATRQLQSLMDQRVLVQIDSWPRNSRYPHGHYVRTLGPIGDKDTETTVLLMEHDIPNAPWTAAVLECLPKESHEINQAHTVGRCDFRSLPIFSIDPPGCTDIDDALHVRQLPNGNFEVGVHIADVSHYVLPETTLDEEAAHRGTSVYLVDRRIDMLPSLLSTNLCSLKPNVDRLTFSVLWELTPDAEIVDTTFQKAVIRSIHAFTYQQAQDRIDSSATDMVSVACRQLNNLAKRLKQRRVEAGALMLASSEVKFVLDKESQAPQDVEMYQLKEANSLVEEFMLLANISVAKRILEFYPTFALLRRHPEPPTDNFLPLIKAGRSVGFDIRADSSKQLAESLDRAEIPGYPFFNKLIRILATRCMTQAIYFSSGDNAPHEYRHYGLASPVYTHFTSPIRRYADIVVHRLLASSLGLFPLPKSVQDRERVRIMADTINHRHRMAQLVSRASTELYTLIYFSKKEPVTTAVVDSSSSSTKGVRVISEPVEETAMIVSIRSNGVRVMIPRYGIEQGIALGERRDEAAKVRASAPHDSLAAATAADPDADADADASAARSADAAVEEDEEEGAGNGATQRQQYVYDDENLVLSGPAGTFRIFDQVRVRLCVKEKNRRRWLSVELVETVDPVSGRSVAQVESVAAIRTRQQLPAADADAVMRVESGVAPISAKRGRVDESSSAASASNSTTPASTKSTKRNKAGK